MRLTHTPAPLTPAESLRRVGLFWAAYLVILVLASVPKAWVPARWGQLVWGLLSTASILAVTLFLTRRDRRSLRELGLRVESRSFGRFCVGVAIGAANYALVISAIALAVSDIHFVPEPHQAMGSMLLGTATILVLAFMEELGFRGYPLLTLLPSVGTWRAQALVAIAFGLVHFAFGWDWQRVVFGVLPSALLFGAVAQASGGLAMPTGLHAAMNLARTLTGETANPGAWKIVLDEQATASGATWAAPIGLLITLLMTAAVWGWEARRRRVIGALAA